MKLNSFVSLVTAEWQGGPNLQQEQTHMKQHFLLRWQ